MNPHRIRLTTAAGGTYYGTPPEHLSRDYCGEAPYIASLAEQVGGLAEVALVAGRADVMNETDAFEVEPVKTWAAGVRQAYSYAGMTRTRPNLALYGEADYLKLYVKLRKQAPDLRLWVIRGLWWFHVTNRDTARLARLGIGQ